MNSDFVCEPTLSQHSSLLSLSQVQQLCQHFPAALRLNEWMLVYQTQTHGSSLSTLYRTAGSLDRCMVLLVRDTYGQVFGAVCSSPLRVSSSYYGTGQTFLFSFSPHLQVYKWTGNNSYFLKGNSDSFWFGGGWGRFGLWLHCDLLRGRSQHCDTFNNDILSSVEDFLISELEVWALV
ncbi:TLD domain-containing protein 2-like [Brachyhypopomus gauderio]|uniref:TLD domain-containing protein 2-like n=1 Tax=Brachyhypopomus gauderio TaxID=698409 RepID=UPI004040FEFF